MGEMEITSIDATNAHLLTFRIATQARPLERKHQVVVQYDIYRNVLKKRVMIFGRKGLYCYG